MDTPGCPRTVFLHQAVGAGLASPALIHENQIFCEKVMVPSEDLRAA